MSQDHVPVPVSFEGVRRTGGQRRYWKSLDELADAPAFLEFLHREFPEQASMFEDPKGRREFMTLMGASLALAGLTACTKQPDEKILPYVRQPEQLVPGRPLFFATATGHDGYARGILVESHEGRPTKIEGNPEHPASLGGTDVFGQAHVLGLYDPDRSKAVLYLGQQRTWGDFKAALREPLAKQQAKGGTGLRFLTGRNTSPTFAAQMQGLLAAVPGSEVDELGAGQPRQRPRGRGARLRRAGRAAVPLRPGRRDPEPRGRLRLGPPGEPAPGARVRRAPEAHGRDARDEPRLRRRGLAHVERRLRRPSPGAAQLRDRGLRARRGRGAGRSPSRVARPTPGSLRSRRT